VAYEIPIISRNRCCNSNCEAGNPEAPTCWEVYLPGTNPEDDLPYRWYIDANVYDTIDGRMYDAIGRQHLYQPTHADCFPCSEGTDPVENIVGLRAIRFLKIGDCGPIRVSWMFGNGIGQGCGGDDDADYYTFTDRTDSRLVLTTGLGDTILIPCQTPYIEAEDAPTCLWATGGVQLDQILVQNGGPCGDTDEPHTDLFGALTDATETKTISWSIDSNQANITITYNDGTTTYTATIPFEREWWLSVLDLFNEDDEVVNVYDCSQVPCEPYLCFPLCVANTCPDDPETVNASAVFITANDGATDHEGEATWSDITSEYSFSFDVGALCGTLSGRIYCDGEDIKVDFDLFDGAVHTYATFTVTWECVDDDVSWTTPTAVSGISCALDITLWTNNGGGA